MIHAGTRPDQSRVDNPTTEVVCYCGDAGRIVGKSTDLGILPNEIFIETRVGELCAQGKAPLRCLKPNCHRLRDAIDQASSRR